MDSPQLDECNDDDTDSAFLALLCSSEGEVRRNDNKESRSRDKTKSPVLSQVILGILSKTFRN